jgi:hypothetical protein
VANPGLHHTCHCRTKSDVMELKKDLMNQFKCKDCRTMDEYVGCTIKKLKTGGVKKFYYKATEMNLTLEALRSSIPQLHLELC